MNLVGHKIYLRFLKDTDAGPLAEMHRKKREFWQRYTPDRPEEFYTEEYQFHRKKIRPLQMKLSEEGVTAKRLTLTKAKRQSRSHMNRHAVLL
ncbi:hypothetical protein [Parageobacillus thermoglucosidasius]|uniref:hypothetical protein n=1 Tax=Parageobacillus thermoglucosidasius TaxID=1426 RepID=UPI00025B5931|nr:hypothetical protein [Parageobacillus thermoglucosidasius]EID43980.1 hypothetical protein GT20_2080 [Parageobacillus thermoglucosidasius TNO-09.020]KYD15890.1 hypothetical protein B4168_4117 [Anoxybacillus flavithermus]OAO88355.1 hypothetical protein GT23_0448 [Parageobacillus thermoglucosidasius]